MNSRVRRWRLGTWYAVALLAFEAVVGCGSDDDDSSNPGAGGTSSAGKGAGGSSGKAGDTSTKGGSAGKGGGKGGSGGSSGTAGGGTTSVGGGSAVGGGGSAGAGMMTNPRCNVQYRYDVNIEDVSLPYSNPASLREDADLAQNPTVGAGTPGALEVTVPFTAEDQVLRVSLVPYEYALTGYTLTARVMLGKGLTSDEAHPGRARLTVMSGLELVYATGPEFELVEDEWATLRFDPLNPDTVEDEDKYDPASVFEIAVELMSGENAGTKYTKATVYIDDLSVCKSTNTGMGGSSGKGGSSGMGGTGGSGNAGGEGGIPGDAGNGSGNTGNASGAGGEGGA
jgi:hypothetical protein